MSDDLEELAIGLGQVRYILKSVANGDDQREVAPKAAEIVDAAIAALRAHQERKEGE